MPRQARLEIPGVPLHITQRGVNQCAIFLDDEDRRHYLRLLGESAASHGLRIHAYVLMGNHVRLLVSSDESGQVSLGMRQLGQAYVTASNRRHGRTEMLWEGRFKSCLVDSDLRNRHWRLPREHRGDSITPIPSSSPAHHSRGRTRRIEAFPPPRPVWRFCSRPNPVTMTAISPQEAAP